MRRCRLVSGSTRAALRRVNAWLRRHCGRHPTDGCRARGSVRAPLYPSMPPCSSHLHFSSGVAAGASGVLVLMRPALDERRRSGARVVELERELAGADGPGSRPPSRGSTTGSQTPFAPRLPRRSSRPVPGISSRRARSSRRRWRRCRSRLKRVDATRRAGRPRPRPVLRRAAAAGGAPERTHRLTRQRPSLASRARPLGRGRSSGTSSSAPGCWSTATSPRRRPRGRPKATSSGPT